MDITDPPRREQVKDELLALLGHELRNPLGPIRNAVQILRTRGVADAQSLWALDLIERQLDEVVSVLESLSQVSRIFRGVATTAAAPFAIAGSVDAAVQASTAILELKQQRCDVVQPAGEVQAVGDRKRTEQALRALLRCASKSLATGAAIAIDVTVADASWTIGVGSPVAADAKWEQEGSSRVAPHATVELSLVRALSELLGGRFVVRAASGDAVRYELELPLRAG